MKKILFAAMVCTMALGTTAYANPGKNVKVVASKMDAKSRGASPIKVDRPTTDKVEEKTRGNCSVNFKNHTGYYVNVYVDGTFRGTLSPYSSGNVTVGGGYTTIYCETAGKTYNWNASGSCTESYNYDLYVN